MSGCSRTAASATPPNASAKAPALPTVAVAYSGGRDSTALLFATLVACRPLGLPVAALHVHHGLSADADSWLAHCAEQCRRWEATGHAIAFRASRLVQDRSGSDSVEAWARRGRYRALRQMALASGASIVLLGQHQRDQAETFLLQALRGGGVAGLAAMPKTIAREGITWSRPWLDVLPEAIAAYARTHGLSWIEDGSNGDTRFARNRLRHLVWPALAAAFPEAAKALARSARWAHEAASLGQRAAAADLPAVADAGGLILDAWRALAPPRQSNALRHWLHGVSGRAAPSSLVERLMQEAGAGEVRAWPMAGGVVRSYRGRLRWAASVEPSAAPSPCVLDAHLPGRYAIAGWNGTLVVSPVEAGGIAPATAAALELSWRTPGDRFQAGAQRPPRSLKLQYQSAAIPAFERGGPIVRSQGRLIFVPGLGIDARAIAPAGEPQLGLDWEPAAPPLGAAESRQGAG